MREKRYQFTDLNEKVPSLKVVHGIKGVLANVFRRMATELNAHGPRWQSLMETYLQREVARLEKKRRDKEFRNWDPNKPPINHQEMNRIDRTSVRGNIHKELGQSTMTWNVFVKGLVFLGIKRFRIIILAQHKNGVITQHDSPVVELEGNVGFDNFMNEMQEVKQETKPAFDLTQITLPGFEETDKVS